MARILAAPAHFPRILGHYVREQKVLPLESAIQKMTATARPPAGTGRPRSHRAGYIADLVVFDPATVIDSRPWNPRGRRQLGIPSGHGAGEWVIDKGQPTGNHPGHVLRSAAFRP